MRKIVCVDIDDARVDLKAIKTIDVDDLIDTDSLINCDEDMCFEDDCEEREL
jgi:hypothetical protein